LTYLQLKYPAIILILQHTCKGEKKLHEKQIHWQLQVGLMEHNWECFRSADNESQFCFYILHHYKF